MRKKQISIHYFLISSIFILQSTRFRTSRCYFPPNQFITHLESPNLYAIYIFLRGYEQQSPNNNEFWLCICSESLPEFEVNRFTPWQFDQSLPSTFEILSCSVKEAHREILRDAGEMDPSQFFLALFRRIFPEMRHNVGGMKEHTDIQILENEAISEYPNALNHKNR